MIFIDGTKIDDSELGLVVQFIKKLVFQCVKFGYSFRSYIDPYCIEWAFRGFT